MNIKAEIEGIVSRIKEDKDLMQKFQADPVKAIEGILGRDLPDETVNQIITAVKANLTADTVKDTLGKLGGLFKK